MIIFFSFLANHENVIKEQSAAHRRRVDDLHVLELRLLVLQHRREGDPEPRELPFLVDPAVGHQHGVGDLLLPLLQVYEKLFRLLKVFLVDRQAVGHAPRDEPRCVVQALELVLQHIHALRRLHLSGACEHIHSSVSVLWPGVNGHMGLGDHHHTTDPEGLEVVEVRANDRSIADLRTVKEIVLNALWVVQ